MKYGLLFLLILLSQNAFGLYGPKIEQSNEAFVVSLHLNDKEKPDRGYFCSGVLIAPTKILTAGHCIDATGLDVYEMSQALVYRPQLLKIQVGQEMLRAKSVTFAGSYFEGSGFDAEDLALIELVAPVKGVTPIQIAAKNSLKAGQKLSLIARGYKVETTLTQVRNFQNASILILDKDGGACAGDSGGAIVIKENGPPKLAGILMYDGGRTCYKKSGYGYFPKARP